VDRANRKQIYILVRNAVIAFVLFFALIEAFHLISWRSINWEVVAPTALGLATSLGIWWVDWRKEVKQQELAVLSKKRAEYDAETRQRQDTNLALITELQENLSSTVITLDTFEDELMSMKATDGETLKRLSELERDLQTHREKYAHTGAENALRSQQRALYKLRAQLDGLSGRHETEKRIDTVLEAVNQTNAQVERLRHIVRDLSGCLNDGVEENEK
jgi:Mg2+ and Co2+ transporter CorA